MTEVRVWLRANLILWTVSVWPTISSPPCGQTHYIQGAAGHRGDIDVVFLVDDKNKTCDK